MKNIYSLFYKKPQFIKLISSCVLSFVIILGVFLAFQLTQLKTHYSFKQFQPEKHPLIQNDERIKNIFNLNRSPYSIVLEISETHDTNWLNNDRLDQLTQFEKEILNEYENQIVSLVSLASVQTAVANKEIFSTGTLSDLKDHKKGSHWVFKDELITPHFLTSNKKSTALYLVPQEISIKKHSQLIKRSQQLAQKIFPDAKIYIGGPPVIRTQMTQLLNKELAIFISLAFSMALLVLFIVFSSKSVLFMSSVMILIANVFALSLMVFFEIPFTVLSTTLPILVTITVVAISSHTYVRLEEELIHSVEKNTSHKKFIVVLNVFKELIKPHALTALTTAVGFGTLYFSDVPLIRQYGLSVSLGVLVACLTTLLTLPFLFAFFDIPQTRKWFHKKTNTFSYIQLTHSHKVFWGITSFIALMAIIGLNISWSAQLFTDLPKDHPARKATEYSSQHLGGVVSFEITIEDPTENENTWKNVNNVKLLNQLTQKWQNHPKVGSVVSLSSFLKASQDDYKLPQTSKAVSEVFLLYGMAEENPLNSYKTPKGHHTRIGLRLHDLPADQMKALKKQWLNETQKAFPKMNVHTAGMASTIHELSEEVSKDLMFGFYKALFWIFILLSLAFKSIRWALVSIIPNLLPPSILLGALALTQTPIKPGIALIFAISLGVAFDNTVYILGRLKELLNSTSVKDHQLPLVQLLQQEVRPCLLSSFSLMAGFSIFVFSYFSMNKIFGAFMLFALISGLIGDLVLLPALLKVFPQLLIPLNNDEKIEPIPQVYTSKGTDFMKQAASLVLIALPLLLYSLPSYGFESAQKILKKVEQSSSPKFESSELKMLIFEPDGSKKERQLTIKRKNLTEQKTIVKILSPMDLKGVGFLSVQNQQKEDQWLYLPSAKRARRILGSSKNSRFLDSDLTYEDFRISTYKYFKNTVLKKESNKKIAVIESKSKKRSSSTYGKIKTWVTLKDYKVIKSEYYNKRGQLIKTMSFKKYKKFGKNIWRAKVIEVRDIKKKRKTLLTLNKLKLKKINDNEFSLSRLEEE